MSGTEVQAQPPRADAVLEMWAPFALPPVQLKTPLAWCPFIAHWTSRSARVRWESLTGTPLEMNWQWETGTPDDRSRAYKRLGDLWKSEQAAVSQQAQKAKVPFEWTGDERSLERYADVETEGYTREYTWGGQPAVLAVARLVSSGSQAYVASALAPPAALGDPRTTARKVLRTLALADPGLPARLVLPGLSLEMPPGFTLENLRGREGHLYLDWSAKGHHASWVRLGFAEWHLARSHDRALFSSLAKLLFDRGDPGTPSPTTVDPGAPPQSTILGRAPAPLTEGAATEISGHKGVCFQEKRWFHVRAGDWLTRKLGRRFSGPAHVLVWVCPQSHAVWAIGTRSGAENPSVLARLLASRTVCHGAPSLGELDWRACIEAESQGPPGEKLTVPESRKEENLTPAQMRRRQLRFHVRSRPEVRLEKSSRDGTGDLVYEGAPAAGLAARLLRGSAPPKPIARRLALDPVGRCAWEQLADGPTVGRVLDHVSRSFAVHPVEAFPKLLAFLRLLGERRLVEGSLEGVDGVGDDHTPGPA